MKPGAIAACLCWALACQELVGINERSAREQELDSGANAGDPSGMTNSDAGDEYSDAAQHGEAGLSPDGSSSLEGGTPGESLEPGQQCLDGGCSCDGGYDGADCAIPSCTPSWSCDWSPCAEGSESALDCVDSNFCGISSGMPSIRACPTRIEIRRLYWSNGFGCGNPSADWDHCPSTNGMTCLAGQNGSYVLDSATVDFWVFPLDGFDAGDPDFISWEYSLVRLDACYNVSTTRHVLEPTDALKLSGIEANTANAATGVNGWSCVKVGYVRTGSKVSSDSHMIDVYRNEANDSKGTTFYQPTSGVDPSCGITGGVAWFAWNTP